MYVYSVDPVTAATMLLLPQPISVVCCCYAKLLLLPWALLVLCRINLLSFVRYGRVAEDQVLRLQVKTKEEDSSWRSGANQPKMSMQY